MITAKIILLMASLAACVAWGEVRISVTPDGANDRTACVREAVRQGKSIAGWVPEGLEEEIARAYAPR